MNDLERVREALRHLVDALVKTVPRPEWDASLLVGGKPTLLRKPFEPYSGVEGNAGFECAVASGAPHADEPGFHHVRRDEQDAAAGGLFNTDSHVVIVDLVADPRWPAVLRVAGLEATVELEALVRAQVFGYPRQRSDHWSKTVPADIAGAMPKDGGVASGLHQLHRCGKLS